MEEDAIVFNDEIVKLSFPVSSKSHFSMRHDLNISHLQNFIRHVAKWKKTGNKYWTKKVQREFYVCTSSINNYILLQNIVMRMVVLLLIS